MSKSVFTHRCTDFNLLGCMTNWPQFRYIPFYRKTNYSSSQYYSLQTLQYSSVTLPLISTVSCLFSILRSKPQLVLVQDILCLGKTWFLLWQSEWLVLAQAYEDLWLWRQKFLFARIFTPLKGKRIGKFCRVMILLKKINRKHRAVLP